MSPLATHLENYGNQIKVYYDDGTSALALPTPTSIWVISGDNSTGPGPGPGPGNQFKWPFSLRWVTSEFRPPSRPTHDGMDFSGGPAVANKPMPAAAAGNVIIAGVYFGYGNAVVIDHGTVNGHNIKTLYGHQNRLDVHVGDSVTQGQQIGLVGNTGHSFGAHLHFEVWKDGSGSANAKMNPRIFMAEVNPNNEFIYG